MPTPITVKDSSLPARVLENPPQKSFLRCFQTSERAIQLGAGWGVSVSSSFDLPPVSGAEQTEGPPSYPGRECRVSGSDSLERKDPRQTSLQPKCYSRKNKQTKNKNCSGSPVQRLGSTPLLCFESQPQTQGVAEDALELPVLWSLPSKDRDDRPAPPVSVPS